MADALGTPGGVVSDEDHRLNQGGMLAVQGPSALDIRTGVLVGPGTTALVTGTSATGTMTVSIAPHHWVTSRATADGPYLGTKEAATTVNIAAAPGANSRIDVVYVKQNDAGSTVSPDGSTGESYGVVTGTAAASPTKPALPVGATELATVQIAAGTTSTNGAGATITNTARQTGARGTRLHVRNLAERDAITAFPGLEVYRLDTGAVELCTTAGSPGTWVRTNYPYPLGDIAYASSAASIAGGVATEAIITGTQNVTAVTLATGRSYEAVAAGRVSAVGATGLIGVIVRGALGATPTTTSPAVSGAQAWLAAPGGPGQEDFDTGGRPFQVATAGSWQFHTFGIIRSGGATGFFLIPDIRGVHSVTVRDCGPAPAGLRTI